MIDFHTHLGRLGPDPTTTQEAAELVRKMDRAGIEQSVVLPLHDSPHGWYLQCTTEDVQTSPSQVGMRAQLQLPDQGAVMAASAVCTG